MTYYKEVGQKEGCTCIYVNDNYINSLISNFIYIHYDSVYNIYSLLYTVY